MRLLVSVRDEREARIAVAAGAEIVDAKEPSRGALEPVAPATLVAIARVVPATTPLGVALGEPHGADELAGRVHERRGALAGRRAYLKFVPPGPDAGVAVACVRRALPEATVVCAGYADVLDGEAARLAFVRAALAAGADGVLLDTRAKGRGLLDCAGDDELRQLAAVARAAGGFLALAGGLGADDLPRVAATGAAVAGVRGAACDGGRAGALSEPRLRALLAALPGVPRAPAVPA